MEPIEQENHHKLALKDEWRYQMQGLHNLLCLGNFEFSLTVNFLTRKISKAFELSSRDLNCRASHLFRSMDDRGHKFCEYANRLYGAVQTEQHVRN
jgi:hypothetical protein